MSAPAARPALELLGVRKAYGEVPALHEMSLAVADGALLFLLGPSGCGKTTTLRIIAGFITQDAGQVRIHGQAVDGMPPERRNLGMVFQNYALFPHMTVFQNVAFGLRMRGATAQQVAARVRRALELVRLARLEERFPRELSGGQQQRVALARAVVIEPALLLLDEPLSNLDLKLREEMRSEIRGLQRALGITTIFVTHDQDEALSMADEIVVMKDGRTVQVGTPAELYGRPASRFVAHFIGESNLESGKVEAVAEPGIVGVDAAGLRVMASAGTAWGVGDPVAIAVRPERIRLTAGAPGAAGANAFPGTVEECIFRGPTRRYRVRLPHGRIWSVDEAAAGRPLALPVGAAVWVKWEPADCLAIPDV